jgi:outer membrane protein assembly factor BamB
MNRAFPFVVSFALALAIAGGCATTIPSGPVSGWLSWRGPLQSGVSLERGLVTRWTPGGENHLWSLPLKGRGTPVISGDRLFAMGYRGEGEALEEVLVGVDVATGAIEWEHAFRDFLSDVIYDRYSIGSPTLDPATGDVHVMTTNGVIAAFTSEGALLWSRSLLEERGRLAFPNGRTGAPIVEGELVIHRGITTNWGRQGPARDRFYAFEKRTGVPVWVATPGIGPKDSSFSTPVIVDRDGQRVLFAGTGCGNVVAINARTGMTLWRKRLSIGGVNASVVVEGDRLVAIHGKENLDTTQIGRMVALDLSTPAQLPAKGRIPVLPDAAELWRFDAVGQTSSPVVSQGVIHQVTQTGVLLAIDIATGQELWRLKIGPDQLHASPLLADGHLYIPLRDGTFHIVKATRERGEIVHSTQLEGSCIGSPAALDGRVFVHTTEALHAFGIPTPHSRRMSPDLGTPGAPAELVVVPAEFAIAPSGEVQFRGHFVDESGRRVGDSGPLKWEAWIPPTAKVQAHLAGSFSPEGVLRADEDAGFSAGAFRATAPNGMTATVRGRVLPAPPFGEDFEGFTLKTEGGPSHAHPHLAWNGARLKWRVEHHHGSQVLAKTLDRMLFQRSMVFFGAPERRNYRMQVDILSDGDRRTLSSAGVVHQRYLIALKGNQQRLEVHSNYERFRRSVPFRWRPGTWMRLETEVTRSGEGATRIRARAWPRGEDPPDDWQLDVEHTGGHGEGAPGLFGFSPQNRHRVYIDNLEVTPL